MHEVAKKLWQTKKDIGKPEEVPHILSINCMSLKQPTAVYGRALMGLQTKTTGQAILYAGM